MNKNDPQNPNPHNASELPDPLRKAVDAVWAQPIPQDAMQRAVDRAARQAMPKPASWRGSRGRLLAIGSVAAACLLTIGLYASLKWMTDGRHDQKTAWFAARQTM